MRVRPRVVVLSLLGLVVAGALLLLYSRELFGVDVIKNFFLQQLETSLRRKIEVDRVKLVVLPSVRLELSNVGVYGHDDPTHLVFKAKEIDIVLRLLPLLKKQVVAKRIFLDEPTVTLIRNRSGHWNVLAGLPSAAKDESAYQMFSRLLQVREAAIHQGHITITDEARPDGVRSTRLESVEMALKVYPGKAQGDLHISASLPAEAAPSSFSLTGTIGLSESSSSLAAEEPYSVRPAFQFDGEIETTNLRLREAADFFGPRPVPAQLQGGANLQSRIRVAPGVAGYDVVLTEIAANVDELAITGKANMAGLLTSQPTFSITFASPTIDLKTLFARMPAQWIHPQLPGIVEQRQLGGTVEIVSATLTGATAPSPQLSLTGDFRIEKGTALIGNDRVPTQDLSAIVSVEPGRIRVGKVRGSYGTLQMTDGKAVVSFLDEGPWMELDISGNMTAADLLKFLTKTIRADRLTSLLAQSREIEGQTHPTFRLVGPLDKPEGITFAGGEVLAEQVSLLNPSLPQRLTALQGRIVFSQTGGAQFDQVTANMGETQLQFNGMISGGTPSIFQDFIIRAKGSAAQLRQLVSAGTFPDDLLYGIVNAKVQLSGPSGAPHLRGEIGLNEAKLVLPMVGEKPLGSPASLELDADVTRGVGLVISRLELVVPPLRLPLKGHITLGDQFSIDASLASGTVSLSSLPEWIYRSGFEAGNLEVSMDVKGTDAEWRNWRTGGWLALTNGLMSVKGVEGQVEDIYLRLKFSKNIADIKQLSFRIKDSDVSLSGALKNWTTKPVIAVKIESTQMDLDLLIPKGHRSPIREFLETLASTSQVSATATIEKGIYKHLRFGGLSGRLTIQDGMLDLDRVVAQSGTGHAAGRMVVRLPKGQPAETETSLRMTGIPAESLLPLLGAQDQPVTGEMKLTGVIRGHGRNPHGILPTLNGKVELVMQDGRILKTEKRAIWKILSILNLPAVLQGKVDLEKEGLQYNRASTTLTIQNGLVKTQNIVLDSPVLKISAVGNYDMPTDQVDMIWAVSPFGSYSQFLKSIPLFGRLMAGDRKGLATALFQVKGSIDDPDVTYLPMKSFATGLTGVAQLAFDLLKNTVMLPIDILSPQEEKDPMFDPSLEIQTPPSKTSPAEAPATPAPATP